MGLHGDTVKRNFSLDYEISRATPTKDKTWKWNEIPFFPLLKTPLHAWFMPTNCTYSEAASCSCSSFKRVKVKIFLWALEGLTAHNKPQQMALFPKTQRSLSMYEKQHGFTDQSSQAAALAEWQLIPTTAVTRVKEESKRVQHRCHSSRSAIPTLS